VRLAGAGWAKQMNCFVPVNEVELSQREDPIAIERGLEGEVAANAAFDNQTSKSEIKPCRRSISFQK